MINVVGSKDNFISSCQCSLSHKYSAIHKWVARYKPRTYKCEQCQRKSGRTEFANISGTYLHDLDDWAELCMRCHAKFDNKGEAGRRNIRKWHARKRTLTHCRQGHEFTPENTRILESGSRMCRTCDRARKARWRAKRG